MITIGKRKTEPLMFIINDRRQSPYISTIGEFVYLSDNGGLQEHIVMCYFGSESKISYFYDWILEHEGIIYNIGEYDERLRKSF